MKKPNRIDTTLGENGKKFIRDYMKEREKNNNNPKYPFPKLAEIFNHRYNSKTIAEYWRNKLDPRLDHSPFSQEEKNYIYEWVKVNHPIFLTQEAPPPIRWKSLQVVMEIRFGKFRSLNSLKNNWNANERRCKRVVKVVENKGNEIIEEMQLDLPVRMEHEAEPSIKHTIQYLLNNENDNVIEEMQLDLPVRMECEACSSVKHTIQHLLNDDDMELDI